MTFIRPAVSASLLSVRGIPLCTLRGHPPAPKIRARLFLFCLDKLNRVLFLVSLQALELLALVALGREHDIVLEVQGGLVVALERLKVDDEIVLDGKDGVRLQPGVVLGVELGGDALEVVVGDLRPCKSNMSITNTTVCSVYAP